MPPSQDASKQALWDETWKRVDRFLPELRSDLASEVLGTKLSMDSARIESGENERKEALLQTSEVARDADYEVREEPNAGDGQGAAASN